MGEGFGFSQRLSEEDRLQDSDGSAELSNGAILVSIRKLFNLLIAFRNRKTTADIFRSSSFSINMVQHVYVCRLLQNSLLNAVLQHLKFGDLSLPLNLDRQG